jgi:hypothetical protein
LTTYSGYAAEDDTARSPGGRPWLAGGVTITGRLGSAGSTAVVEPRAFTTGLMRAAQAHGAVLRRGAVVNLVRGPSGAVRGVALASGEIVDGDGVVIAMRPWSILAARWLPLPAVIGYKGHSLVFETGGATPRQSIERAAAAPVERQGAARLAGCRAGDLVTLDDDRPGAASAHEVGDRGADRTTTADHHALARAHYRYFVRLGFPVLGPRSSRGGA